MVSELISAPPMPRSKAVSIRKCESRGCQRIKRADIGEKRRIGPSLGLEPKIGVAGEDKSFQAGVILLDLRLQRVQLLVEVLGVLIGVGGLIGLLLS